MSTPIHRTCYRCERPVPELVEPADKLGGTAGVCSDCRLTLGAEEVARRWHLMHPELPCAPMAEGGKPEAGDLKPEGVQIPRGIEGPHCVACGTVTYAAGAVWQCPSEDCRNFQPISPALPDNQNEKNRTHENTTHPH